MRKLTCSILLSIVMLGVQAQYTDVLDFNGTNGLNPYGSLVPSVTGDTLYGTAAYGGAYNAGCVFSVLHNGSNYNDLLDFDGITNGSYPFGSLTLSPDGKTLYGTTSYGVYGQGSIFSVHIDGTSFTDIFEFSGSYGSTPYGSVTLSVTADSLFLLTSTGGNSGFGDLFCVAIDGSVYDDVLDFNGFNGAYPYGSLTWDKGYLFGMTSEGGTGYGNIFAFNPHTLSFASQYNFDGTFAAYPYGSLTASVTGDSLYGMTSEQGISYGNLFTFVLGGGGYSDLYEFSGADGSYPNGDLVLARSGTGRDLLYGLTNNGGLNGYGNLFSIKTNGARFTDLFDFSGTNGSFPYGSVTFLNDTIYGLCSQGGLNNEGLVFAYDILRIDSFQVINVTCDKTGTIGNATAYPTGGVLPYTYSWSPGGSTNQGISGLPAGTYTVTVSDNTGSHARSVAVISEVSVSISEVINVSCYGGNNGSIQATPSGGTAPYVYSWTTPGLSVASTGLETTADRGLTAGIYILTITDSCGTSATATATVTQPPLLSVTDSVTANVHCTGGSSGVISATVTGGVSPYTYLWTDGSSQTTATATGLSAGKYYITITDNNGCTAIDSVIVSQPAKPALGVTITRAKNVSCSGSFDGMALALASGGVAPYTYIWTPGGATTSLITGLSAGVYTVQVTDSRGCDAVASANITQPSVLIVTDTTIATIAAAYPSGGTPPYTFTWAPGGSTNSIASGISAGTYTVVVTDNNGCRDSAVVLIPTSAELTFYLSTPTVNCSYPSSYVNFAVMVASDTPTMFNNCLVNISYSGNEFSGDDFSNGGILVTRGANFQYVPGVNDYNYFDSTTATGDSVMQLTLGDSIGTSPGGTLLTSTPQAIFNISLRIQNSCDGEGSINLNPVAQYAYYTAVIPHFEGYVCDSCNYDFTCDCYLDTCCYDSVVTVDTNIQWTGVIYSPTIVPTPICILNIFPIYTPINAGTNAKSVPPNSSLLTITGWGFGTKPTPHPMSVVDANGSGSFVYLDSTDVMSWSENKVVIKMPSYLINNHNATPGSGNFYFTTNCGSIPGSGLIINYNIKNVLYPLGKKTRPNIVMTNDTASFIFHCDTSVSNNPQAMVCVKKTIEIWNCYTGVNWKLGNNDTLEVSNPDGISDIYFSDSKYNFPDTTDIMVTTPEVYGCRDSVDSVAFYNEADIQIKRGQYLPNHKLWNYDTSYTSASDSFYYFYDNMLHELGHAHGLGHIMDNSSLMYWQIPAGRRATITGGTAPGPQTLYGAFDMINTSVANPPRVLSSDCSSDSVLVTDTRECRDLALNIISVSDNSYNLNLYPNPNNGLFTISYTLSNNSYIQFKIIDYIGREIMKLNYENKPPGTYKQQVNMDIFANGAYLLIANFNGNLHTIKFIKL